MHRLLSLVLVAFLFSQIMEVTSSDKSFHLYSQGMAFLNIMPMDTMKNEKLICVPHLHTPFHGRKILYKYFSWITSALVCVVDKSIAISFRYCSWTLMALRRLFSMKIQVTLSGHANLITFFIIYLTLRRFLSGSVYNLSITTWLFQSQNRWIFF